MKKSQTGPFYGDEGSHFPLDNEQPGYAGGEAVLTERPDDSQLKWQIDTSDVLEEVKHFLRGEVFDYEKQRFALPRSSKPLMNEEGIKEVMLLVQMHVNKIVGLSRFTQEQINEWCYEVVEAVIDKVFWDYKRFDLDKSNFDWVKTNLEHVILANINHALDGENKILARSSQKVTERILVGEQDRQDKKRWGVF